VLIPETVSIKEDSIAIGRFEVTNAQFAAYKNGHDYPAVRANYPATGITAEQARGYAEWLSELTGDTYRLPNTDEAESLHKQARKVAADENTLNYWAGYEITIDEVPELRQKMQNLRHSLLKEAGSYKGTKIGKALVYDLGGNAAEYHSDGSIYGYSAVSYVDERGEADQAPASYTGFRVIQELMN